jgi:UDP-N-acetylmuramate dehydrogenase
MGDLKFSTVKLSDYTTIKLGGMASKFVECTTDKDISDAIVYAKQNKTPFHVLGGGSNTVFSEKGYNGIIIYINTKGVEKSGDHFSVKAGESWDDFVKYVVGLNYSGIECLSGIPGSTGATPIQNVGAYGAEVSNVIETVKALDVETLNVVEFSNKECNFSYRNSRFKSADKNKYIVTDVVFRLNPSGIPEIKYKELDDYLGTYHGINSLTIVRDAVLNIRKKKSMVYDENDKDSFSCGSFFTNPLLNSKEFDDFIFICKSLNLEANSYKSGDRYKISAAWLIENSGFSKGLTENGIGISNKHTLAIVNRGGSTADLINFSEKIKKTVYNKFKISLEREPELV